MAMNPTPPPPPDVLQQIEGGLRAGKTAFVLTWNTNDRQIGLEHGLPPAALHLTLATYFGRRGYHIGLYSQGLGLQGLAPPSAARASAGPPG